MKVKICGLKEEIHVQAAVQAGADYLGFVFTKSSRQVTLSQAKELVQYIPKQIKKVGVFVNPTLSEVLQAIKKVPLDCVQLHGQETPEFVAKIPVEVIKAFSVKHGNLSTDFNKYPEEVILLVDAPAKEFAGGSGEKFDWKSLNLSLFTKRKILVAGGLTVGNVQTAIQYFHPYGVDVSSGVETAGRKDSQKIKAFIQQVKGEKKNEVSSSR